MNTERWERALAAMPQRSIALARWVSLATRITPALLRSARLQCLPTVGVQAEADVWFGPLVEIRGAVSIMFYSEVAQKLRKDLACNERAFVRAQALLDKAQPSRAPLVRIEEQLVYAAARHPRDEEKIERLLRQIIKAIVDERRSGLARWAFALRHRIAEIANVPAAVLLEHVCRLSLGVEGSGTVDASSLESLLVEDRAILSRAIRGTVDVGVRADGGVLVISEPPAIDDEIISIPASEPRVVYARDALAGSHAEPIRLRRQHSANAVALSAMRATSLPVTLTTIAGDRFEVLSFNDVIRRARRGVAPFMVIISNRRGQMLGLGVIVSPDIVLTSNRALELGTVSRRATFKGAAQAGDRYIVSFAVSGQEVRSIALTRDGRHVISASADTTISFWDTDTRRHSQTLSGHTRSVNAVAVTPDGRRLISASDDQTLKVWDIENGRELQSFTGHAGSVNAVAVTPDGRRLVSGSDDQTLKVWDVESGRELQTFTGHAGSVNAVAVTSDGRRLVSASDDHTLKVWDIESGRQLQTLARHVGPVNAVAITPDGRIAVSASADRALLVWEMESGRALQTLAGHSDSVNAVAVTPDGHRAISASSDQTLKVWNIESGREERTILGQGGSVSAVTVMRDGKRALFASDEVLHICNISRGNVLLRFVASRQFDASLIRPVAIAESAELGLAALRLAKPAMLRVDSAGPAVFNASPATVVVPKWDRASDISVWTSFVSTSVADEPRRALKASRKVSLLQGHHYAGSPVVNPTDGSLVGMCLSDQSELFCLPYVTLQGLAQRVSVTPATPARTGIELALAPATVYRVAKYADAWHTPALTRRSRSELRYGDPLGVYEVIYAASSRYDAYVDVLAHFRPSSSVLASIAELEGNDVPETTNAGAVMTWLSKRYLGEGTLNGDFADLTSYNSIEFLRHRLASQLMKYGVKELDPASLASAPREVTMEISRCISEIESNKGDRFSGFCCIARKHGEPRWVIFDKGGHLGAIRLTSSTPIDLNDRELVRALIDCGIVDSRPSKRSPD